MYRTYPYILLFAATLLLQVFLFDNLTISIYLNPLVYILFIALLPLDAQPVVLLGAGLLMGLSADAAMGAAGLNTLATLPVAVLRPTLVGLVCTRDDAREGGVPTPERLGLRSFLYYLTAVVLLHHALFFLFEALSWQLLYMTLLRIAVSAAATVASGWIVTRVFTAKLTVRV